MSFDDWQQGSRRAAANGRPADPLAAVIQTRDQEVLDMVEQAVAENNVMLAFQPIVSAARLDRPAFYEGLVRLMDRTGRIIPAADFIEEVEPRALGRRIDTLSLRLGLATLQEHPSLRLAINLSAKSIDFPAWTATIDNALHLDPAVGERLILEITERTAIEMPDAVADFMNEYQRRGVSFAIDDFGSGYTSMRYLKDLYFDILKIDGQFVRGIAKCPDNRALVSAMVSLGRHFDMVTIAEMVETVDDAEILRSLGVDCLQGYYFGAPTIRPQWLDCEEDARLA